MLGKLGRAFSRWRESRRQYQIERALYKAGGNDTGAFAHGSRVAAAEGRRELGVKSTDD